MCFGTAHDLRKLSSKLSLTSLQVPQLFANFRAQSADGLSMAFLIVWLLGDATNLMGESPYNRFARLADRPGPLSALRLDLPALSHWRSCGGRYAEKLTFFARATTTDANVNRRHRRPPHAPGADRHCPPQLLLHG